MMIKALYFSEIDIENTITNPITNSCFYEKIDLYIDKKLATDVTRNVAYCQ